MRNPAGGFFNPEKEVEAESERLIDHLGSVGRLGSLLSLRVPAGDNQKKQHCVVQYNGALAGQTIAPVHQFSHLLAS